MEYSKKRIQRIGKLLRRICKFLKILFILSIIVLLTSMLIYIVQDSLGFESVFDLNDDLLSGIVSELRDSDILSPIAATIIANTISIITMIILYLFANETDTFLLIMEKGDQPFSFESAHKLRRLSYGTLIFLVFNLFTGIIIFLMTQLLSYLFEYGAYLQQRADETYRIQ